MELSFGQRICGETGLVESWFTHGSLDKIKSMDWSDKVVLMYGAGKGDVWLANRCKALHVIERSSEWLAECTDNYINNGVGNLIYYHRPCNDSSGMDEMYCEFPVEPDVVIVDDAYRYECIVKAFEYGKKQVQGVILIVDNWQQDYVFICPAAEELLKNEMKEVFVQADHKDHSGKPWQTLIAYI